MIDIHCHILPSVDDGAPDLQESIRMAQEAVSEGIHTMIATPHHMNGKYFNEKTMIFPKVKKLNEVLQKESIPLTVLPGQETRIFGEMVEDFKAEKLLPLNQTQYIFIELPSGHVPRYTERLLFDIQLLGLAPVIVHPERNQGLIEQPDLLYNLVRNGALTQVTSSSVAGYFGKKIKTFSKEIIEANLTHFLASDAHNTTNRSFKWQEGLDVIEDTFGQDYIYLFSENAKLLIQGKNVMKEIPEKIKVKKKFLGIF